MKSHVLIMTEYAKKSKEDFMNEGNLLNIQQVAAKVNLTQNWIYAKMKSGTFPHGVKIGSARLWNAEEVKDWALKNQKEVKL